MMRGGLYGQVSNIYSGYPESAVSPDLTSMISIIYTHLRRHIRLGRSVILYFSRQSVITNRYSFDFPEKTIRPNSQ